MPKITAKSIFEVKPRTRKAIALLLDGVAVNDVAKEVGVSRRSISTWRKQFNELFIMGNTAWLQLQARLIWKSLKVYEDYLDGKGAEAGGDLTVATNLLKNVGLLSVIDKIQVNDNSKNITVNKTDITINPKENVEFAEGAIDLIPKLARAIEATGTVIESSSKEEADKG